VPGVVFDEYGNRIGYGGGYFDKLLSNVEAIKIGLSYEFQVLKHIPHEEHDVKMDYILTEKKILCTRG
jgi:5-formyltetrahydrofolate cyclo-ligase